MDEHNGTTTSLTIYALLGIIFLYFAISWTWVLSGIPALTACLVAYQGHRLSSVRLTIGSFLLLNWTYWISSTSYVLYPAFAIVTWLSVVIVTILNSDALRSRLKPIQDVALARIRQVEQRVENFKWPVLDFDGRGYLVFSGSHLDCSEFSFTLGGLDFSLEVDEVTKIIAKLDTITIRLARDITIGELFVNVKGDGIPSSAAQSFTEISRTPTSSSVGSTASRKISDELGRPGSVSEQSPIRKLPPLLPSEISLKQASITPTKPPALPPRLPPRRPSSNSISSKVTAEPGETEEDKRNMELALAESLLTSNAGTQMDTGTPGKSSVEAENPNTSGSVTQMSEPQKSLPTQDLATSLLGSDGADEALQAALDENSIHHTASVETDESLNDTDTKAAIAASLQDQADLYASKANDPHTVHLSDIIRRIPWWLKITPGPLATRLILSVLAWAHPIKVVSVAATSTGKRITNLMESSGLKKAHPNQEIFRLIRKVFLWLEAGDISVILSDISVLPHIPISADNDINIEVKAREPTAYRKTYADLATEEVLAKIHGLKLSVKIPTFLLPNHEGLIPKTPRSSVPYSVLLSLPGVFNRELLTIGAAFLKATTMMDLRHTAQNRPAPVLPSLSAATVGGGGGGGSGSSGQTTPDRFSFKSFGLAVKQAAGDLAKQKGVQWGVRDAELAKWTAKFAGLVKVMRVDVGTQGEIPIDLYKLRRRASTKKKLMI